MIHVQLSPSCPLISNPVHLHSFDVPSCCPRSTSLSITVYWAILHDRNQQKGASIYDMEGGQSSEDTLIKRVAQRVAEIQG